MQKTSPTPRHRAKGLGTTAEQLTGFNYAGKGSQLKIACPFEGCNNVYLNEYGLERHLASAAHQDDLHAFVAGATTTPPSIATSLSTAMTQKDTP